MLDDGLVRARLRGWPRRPDVAHLVLADHTVAPRATTVREWLAMITAEGFTTIRTGALSPDAARVFVDHGFVEVQRLALLHLTLDVDRIPEPHHRLRPLRGDRAFATAERIDAGGKQYPMGGPRADWRGNAANTRGSTCARISTATSLPV